MEKEAGLIYEAPSAIVIDVGAESVVCASGGLEDYDKQDLLEW